MAPFSKATQLESSPVAFGENGRVYRGSIDPEWLVVMIPHGGYVLGLIVEAAMRFQSMTTQKDPIHVTAHYLRPSAVGIFEIHVRTIKSGEGFTNIAADLFQKNTLKVTTHMIFGYNGPAAGDKTLLTLNPSSPYARRVPLHCHPSEAPKQRPREGPNHSSRSNSTTIGGGGIEWGAWLGFSGKEETLTAPALALMVDMFTDSLIMLPRSERKGLSASWFPTMTLSIEFKAPIPRPSEFHASRTVGLYSTGKFIGHPRGRHETYVEIWTAPTNIGEGEPVDGWRDKQVCLAISTQMNLAIPFDQASKKMDRETTRL